MKVLIVNNMAPFIWGGAEELAVHLQRNIEIAGHQSEIMRIPFQWDPAAIIPSQMLMWRYFELYNVDKVIALKFPAYLVRHPNKVVWLLHQYRQAYDLYDVKQTNLYGEEGKALKEIITRGDNESFSEAKKIFTNSKVTQDRLQHYNGFSSEILLPPVNDAEIFYNKGCDNYIFAGGRINNMKRQHLLIEALPFAAKNVRLIIAGPPDAEADAQRLYKLAESLNVKDRVHFDLRFLSRQQLAEYVNNALACAYLPFDEDSLGYVAMEAATARKALITTSDSGGVLGLVKNGDTGWVVNPNATSLAAVMSEAANSIPLTCERGERAYALWNSFEINWPKTVERLLA